MEQLTQDMNHLEMQGRTLQAYQSRVARLLPELELYRTKFQQLARLANSRCSAMQGPSIGQGREQAGSSSADKTLAAIRALSMELTQALHARAYAWMSGEEGVCWVGNLVAIKDVGVQAKSCFRKWLLVCWVLALDVQEFTKLPC